MFGIHSIRQQYQYDPETKLQRAKKRAQSTKRLKKEKIEFESKNYGAHLIVEGPYGLIDFWPGTGKWKCRNTGKNDQGLNELIDYCC